MEKNKAMSWVVYRNKVDLAWMVKYPVLDCPTTAERTDIHIHTYTCRKVEQEQQE